MFHVYIEGYKIKSTRVTVNYGVNKILTAEIVIPPGEHRREILPGSRVVCYFEKGEEQFEWFRGVVMNSPEVALGFNERPITLVVTGEMGLLSSVGMQYNTLIQRDVANTTFKSQHFNGIIQIFHNGGLGPLLSPIANVASDRGINYGGKLLGILHVLLAMDSNAWQLARRLRFLDRLRIDIAENIAGKLDNGVVFGQIGWILNQIQAQIFTAYDVLQNILNILMHEYVSIAPMRYSGDTTVEVSEHGPLYLPKELDLLNPPRTETEVAKMFCKRTPRTSVLIDGVIKPQSKLFVPQYNKITRNMYAALYVNEQSPTRAIARVVTGQQQFLHVREEVMPEYLNNAYEVLRELSAAGGTSKLNAISAMLAERLSGYRTNQEKIFGYVRPSSITIDNRVVAALHLLEKEQCDKEYIKQYMINEYRKMCGASVQITGSPINFDMVPGFGVKIEDYKGDWYTGKLVEKTDIIDLESQHASSSYAITECYHDNAPDYNSESFQPKKATRQFFFFKETIEKGSETVTTKSINELIAEGKEVGQLITESDQVQSEKINIKTITQEVNVFDDPEQAIYRNIVASLKDPAPYEISLASMGLVEADRGVLEPDTRFDANGQPIEDGRLPGMVAVAKFIHQEHFYTVLDFMPLLAAKTFDPEIIGDKEFPLDLVLTPNKAVAVLDSKTNSVFSMIRTILGENYSRNQEELDRFLVATGSYLYQDNLDGLLPALMSRDRVSGTKTYYKATELYRAVKASPIYLGNPSANAIDYVIYLLSRLDKGDYVSFMKNGTFSSFKKNAVIPLSEYDVIKLRRERAKKASDE